MKQKILKILAFVLPGTAIAASAGATSTVILDPPSITEAIGNIYNVAQPLFSSVSGWIWFIVAFAVVFFFIRLIIGIFHN